MSRRDDLSPEDRRIWARVAGSVKPSKRKKALRIPLGTADPEPPAAPKPKGLVKTRGVPAAYVPASPAPSRPRGLPEELEPRRQRRLSRERDPIERVAREWRPFLLASVFGAAITLVVTALALKWLLRRQTAA